MQRFRMLTILFYLRKNKTPLAKVYCRVSLSGTRSTPFSTGVSVRPEHWKHQHTTNPNDNALLDSIRDGLKALNRKMEYDLEVYTVNDLVDTYLGKRDYNDTLLAVYADFVHWKQQEGRTTGTLEVLTNYMKPLKRFIDDNCKGLLVRQVDVPITQKYHAFLLAQEYAKSSINKQLIYLKSVMDYAVLQGIIKYNPIKPYKVEKPKPQKPVYLTNAELLAILRFDFGNDPNTEIIKGRLEKIRDIFIVLRFLGVHWADYLNLSPETLYEDSDGDLIYHSVRQKTEVEALSIVHPIVKGVIAKYGGVENLPKMTNQRYNDYLKMLFVVVGINKPASSKIGRKSFADHFTNVDVTNDSILVKMLGLTSSKHLDHYRRVDIRAFKKLKQKF